MFEKQRKDSLRKSGARGWVILCIALTIPAAQLAAQPAPSDSDVPVVFRAAPTWMESQLEMELDASEPAMGEDMQAVELSPEEIAVLIAERRLYRDLTHSLFRERVGNIVAGAVVGAVLTVSVGVLFGVVGALAAVN
ncbi:MAG: hypothetical protein KAU31_05440 [Spirochaetaceae bacterium]|nr:hypothetical protein [Spirochaetaceae bacterium]